MNNEQLTLCIVNDGFVLKFKFLAFNKSGAKPKVKYL